MTDGHGLKTSSGAFDGHHKEYGELSCTDFTGQANDFELIRTVNMETRHAR